LIASSERTHRELTQAGFLAQADRMKRVWGERNYPEERLKIFWRAFQSGTTDQVFSDALDELIANSRYAPMLDDLSKAVEQAKIRQYSNRGMGGFIETLDAAARNNKSADPEFVAACMKLLRQYLGRKPEITKDQFEQGCGYLDEVAKINARVEKERQNGNRT
jgi:hypothetical protein